jgi:hypothetical protein
VRMAKLTIVLKKFLGKYFALGKKKDVSSLG